MTDSTKGLLLFCLFYLASLMLFSTIVFLKGIPS